MMVHIRREKMEMSTIRHVLLPFAFELWLSVLVAMAVLTVFLVTTSSVSVKCTYKMAAVTRHFSLQNTWHYVFGAFCQQGHTIGPIPWASRLVCSTSYLTALVLFVAYSATFISFLTARRYEMPFSDFRGLLNNGRYKLGILNGSFSINYFRKAKDPVLTGVYKRLIKPHKETLVADDIEGLRNICHLRNYAYVVSTYSSIYALSSSIHCNIVELPRAYVPYASSIIISKNCPFKRLFYHHVQEMRRTGILKRIKQNTWYYGFEDNLYDTSVDTTLETVMIFHYILGIGVLLSILLLTLERVWRTIKFHLKKRHS